ncbi:MAG: EscU/YscU/HrcU family type III secretion system export apparatus switch protein, partial [Rhodospirillaceae bacterium]
ALGFVVWPQLDWILRLPEMETVAMLLEVRVIIMIIIATVLGVMLTVAFADMFFVRYQTHKKLKMTKQEVKDEHKQSEGDPQIKSRIRSIRMERFRKRMMAAVPKADVVITNPTHFAVALSYKMEDMAAPKVVAKGVDFLAKRIRELAEENDVPIVENPPLARALYASVEVDQFIPPEHYRPVAEIISYVMKLKKKR